MRNNTKGLLCKEMMQRFIEMDSHLFLTLETLSAASCLASFSLSNLSFLVQARIALIKPNQKSETEKFFTDPSHCKSLLQNLPLFSIFHLKSAFALINISVFQRQTSQVDCKPRKTVWTCCSPEMEFICYRRIAEKLRFDFFLAHCNTWWHRCNSLMMTLHSSVWRCSSRGPCILVLYLPGLWNRASNYHWSNAGNTWIQFHA